jgi:hypothetical protein
LVGDFGPFIGVHYNPNARANVLGYSHAIIHLQANHYRKEGGTVWVFEFLPHYVFTFKCTDHNRHMENEDGFDLLKKRKLKLRECSAYHFTVEANLRHLPVAVRKRVEDARTFQDRLTMSSKELVACMKNNNVTNCSFRPEHVHLADQALGPSRECTFGRTTRPPQDSVEPHHYQRIIRPVFSNIYLYVDIMFVMGVPFFVSVSDFGFVMTVHLKDRKTATIRSALDTNLSFYKANTKGSAVNRIICDDEGGVSASREYLEGLGINLFSLGVGAHVHKIERTIRSLKDRIRGKINVLPFDLFTQVIVKLVEYCTSTVNIVPQFSLGEVVSPLQKITGQPQDIRAFAVDFGDLCEVQRHLDPRNSMLSKTISAVALRPVGTDRKHWEFLNIEKGDQRFSTFVRPVTSAQVYPWSAGPLSIMTAQSKRERKIIEKKINSWKLAGTSFRHLNAEDIERLENEDARVENIPSVSNYREVIAPAAIINPTEDGYHPEQDVELQASLIGTSAEMPRYNLRSRHASNIFLTQDYMTAQGFRYDYQPSSDDESFTRHEVNDAPRSISSSSVFHSISARFSAARRQLDKPATASSTDELPPHLDNNSSDSELEFWSDDSSEAKDTGYNPVDHSVRFGKHDEVDDVSVYDVDTDDDEPADLCSSSDDESDDDELHSAPIDIASSYCYANKSENIPVKKAVAMGPEPLAATVGEVDQMLTFKVWKGMHEREVLRDKLRQKIYSMMFLRKKRTNQWKARLAAGGNRQNRSIYEREDTSSPTVTTQSVFMLAAIAATKQHDVMTVDITGAYLHCDVKETIYMKLDPIVSKILVELNHSYAEYVTESGQIWVKLNKALYGLVESARLFYDHLCTTLTNVGFEMNPYDRCVFSRTVDGEKQYVCFHVDDLFCTASDPALNDLLYSELNTAYPRCVKRHNARDGVIDYLGMDFDFVSLPGNVVINQTAYIEKVLSAHPVEGEATSPARNNLFDEDTESPALQTADKEVFHTATAKLLYLSKRARPDIQVAVAVLTTRVQEPTKQDGARLTRVLQYLRHTKHKKLILNASGKHIELPIDSSYAVHPKTRKSHTGVQISLGRGTVFAASVKQRIVTKSSSEAELVGTSDGMSQAIWTKHFLDALDWNPDSPIILYQDNQSAKILEEQGWTSNGRMKHLDIRYFWVKQYVDANVMQVRWVDTHNMVADILTKPLQGAIFVKLRDRLLGYA